MGQKIQEKEIVNQKFIAAVHSYFASLQTHNSSLSNRRIVHGVQHLALPLGELAAKPTERALSAPTGHLSHGERQERLCCQYANFQFVEQDKAHLQRIAAVSAWTWPHHFQSAGYQTIGSL